MPSLSPLLLILVGLLSDEPPAPQPQLPTALFEAPKFGLKVKIPKDWPIVEREKGDQVFVALIRQKDELRPGVMACELGLAPENLDEYRTRIDTNASRGTRPQAKLGKNEIIKAANGVRLETIWEFRPRPGELWREVSVRKIVNRQMYTFILNVDDPTYETARSVFDTLVNGAEFTAPNTGADLQDKARNRWVQREFKFALDLPKGWSPVLAPSEVALFFANGEPKGIWSDNLLVLAQAHRPLDLHQLAIDLPDQLRHEEPNCEVLTCRVVKQGDADALETVVRTTRGPFSMTVLERRFSGNRFDYEVKFTVESKRFDDLAPALRKSIESFGEVPGTVPPIGSRKAA